MSPSSPRRPSPLLIGLGLGLLWLVLLLTLVQGLVSVGVLQAAALLIYATTVAVLFLVRRPAPPADSGRASADPWGDQLRAAFGDVSSLAPDRATTRGIRTSPSTARVPTSPSTGRIPTAPPSTPPSRRIPTEPSGARGLSYAEPLPDDAIELFDLDGDPDDDLAESLDADPPTGVRAGPTR